MDARQFLLLIVVKTLLQVQFVSSKKESISIFQILERHLAEDNKKEPIFPSSASESGTKSSSQHTEPRRTQFFPFNTGSSIQHLFSQLGIVREGTTHNTKRHRVPRQMGGGYMPYGGGGNAAIRRPGFGGATRGDYAIYGGDIRPCPYRNVPASGQLRGATGCNPDIPQVPVSYVPGGFNGSPQGHGRPPLGYSDLPFLDVGRGSNGVAEGRYGAPYHDDSGSNGPHGTNMLAVPRTFTGAGYIRGRRQDDSLQHPPFPIGRGGGMGYKQQGPPYPVGSGGYGGGGEHEQPALIHSFGVGYHGNFGGDGRGGRGAFGGKPCYTGSPPITGGMEPCPPPHLGGPFPPPTPNASPIGTGLMRGPPYVALPPPSYTPRG